MASSGIQPTTGELHVAITVHFSPSGIDKPKYDEVMRRLELAGAGSPAGRLYHCCYESGGSLKVVDVYDSPQSFEQFGNTLMPILKSLGIDAGQPEVSPTYNMVAGK
jgi:hypothetical protein